MPSFAPLSPGDNILSMWLHTKSLIMICLLKKNSFIVGTFCCELNTTGNSAETKEFGKTGPKVIKLFEPENNFQHFRVILHTIRTKFGMQVIFNRVQLPDCLILFYVKTGPHMEPEHCFVLNL